jgi:hypothetical protein
VLGLRSAVRVDPGGHVIHLPHPFGTGEPHVWAVESAA